MRSVVKKLKPLRRYKFLHRKEEMENKNQQHRKAAPTIQNSGIRVGDKQAAPVASDIPPLRIISKVFMHLIDYPLSCLGRYI